MPLLFKRPAFLPACLMLGALLCALAALADLPAAPTVSTAPAQSIPLQHTVPGDMLKALHWDQTAQRFDSTAQIHFDGITQISSQPATNSLSVVATPAAFAKVREIVKLLDIAPIPVQIKFALANATAADLDATGINFDLVPYPGLEFAPKPGTDPAGSATPPTVLRYATGKDVALFIQTLAKRGAVVQEPTISTSNNVNASITLSTPSPPPGPTSTTLAVTPRVNSDNSVTLALDSSFLEGTRQQRIKTLRTVKSGDAMVLSMPSSTTHWSSKNLLLFVTPTILPTGGGTTTMTVK